jgi:hypothetical protein
MAKHMSAVVSRLVCLEVTDETAVLHPALRGGLALLIRAGLIDRTLSFWHDKQGTTLEQMQT